MSHAAAGAGGATRATGAGSDLLAHNTSMVSRRGEVDQKRDEGRKGASGRQSGRQRNMLSANNDARTAEKSKSQVSINEYDRQADRSAAAKAKVANVGINGEESSDQKMIIGLSGKDETDTDHFNSIINIPNNQNDILEFDRFMNGIQNKMKEKEERRKRKLERLLGGMMKSGTTMAGGDADLLGNKLDLFLSDTSSSGSSDEEPYKAR